MELAGKTALVTGGASGIGKAFARRLLRGGARVALWDLDPAAAEAARRELSTFGEVRAFAVDVADRAQVASAAERLLSEMGELDLLDNNAGVVFGGDFLSVPEEKLLKTVEVNLNGTLWCTRAFLPGMLRRGSGHLVMMASAAGLLGVPGMAVYSASKHAVVGFAESLRLELRSAGKPGIGLTIVCPSFVSTGMFEGVRPPLLSPWVEPERLAGKIFEAVTRGKLYVREPFLVKLVPALKGLTCPALLDPLADLLGMNRSMEGWKGRPEKR